MSSFALVIIARVTLFIGHIPFAIPDLPMAHGMACIGKLAFPIVAFLIANSYLSDKSNFSKCLTRLIVFAIIAQIFSTLLFFGKITVLYFNIFFNIYEYSSVIYFVTLGVPALCTFATPFL